MIETEWLLFFEVTTGPFDPASTLFPEWAPPADNADAVAAYRRVPVLYPKSDAARDARLQLKSMQEEGLDVRLPGVVIPGRPAVLEIGTRNLRRVEGRVYRIDPVAYFRNG